MLAEKLNSAGGAAASYVDDVFSTYLYTGNSGTQTITNGIDLAGRGGMIWSKARSGTYSHSLWDSASGTSGYLKSDATSAKTTLAGTTFNNNNGFTFSGIDSVNNLNSILYSSWTFRKAPKFFDVVTWTGDNTTRAIQHSLGITPGMIIVKRTDIASTQGWITWHTSTGGTNNLLLNSTASATALVNGRISAATSTNFTVAAGSTNNADVNASGGSYVAYLFAHDVSTDGIIQCGSFLSPTSGETTVTLGWEPQYILMKCYQSTGGNWFVVDNMRGIVNGGNDPYLSVDTASTETNGYNLIEPTVNGFNVKNTLPNQGYNYVYLAIRRSNKPPSSGTQVFQPVVYTGNGSANRLVNTGFLTDLVFARSRTNAGGGYEGMVVGSRLTGDAWMKTAITQAELTTNGLETPTASYGNSFSTMSGFGVTGPEITSPSYGNLNSSSGVSYIAHAFKRAKGFMNIVHYTGTGVNQSISHGLGVIPEMIIVKSRNSGTPGWSVWCSGISNTEYLSLNTTTAKITDATYWNSTTPTSTVFSLGTNSAVNTNTATYECILFATLPGISKVGTYTGNGSNQTINCGFSTGARFVLIKRTDSAGDWYVWDTARGIVTGNDPHLSLNTSAAEVTTDDSIDPDSSGFIVNQLAATNINVTSASYIYLAIS